MSQLVKLVGVSLLGSAALAMAVAHFQPQHKEAATLAKTTSALASTNTAAAKPQPKSPVSISENVAVLYADSRGHFMADMQFSGTPLRALVDTGATIVAMSHEDAIKVGIRTSPGDRKAQFQTANGLVTATLVKVPEIRLQGITVYDVEASIMPPGAMKGTLLGMSFMRKLSSFESRGPMMTMRK